MMALLRHHFIEQSMAWLAGCISPTAMAGRDPALRAMPAVAVDEQSLAKAIALYSGNISLSGQEFSSLSWLDAFAKSGRQLLICHAMKMLGTWTTQRRRSGSLADETDILDRLSISAGQCANLLPRDQLHLHGEALLAQIQRVLRIKTNTPIDLRRKAIALLHAAEVLQQGEAVRAEALHLLDLALPNLIASDGGPLVDDVTTHIRIVQDLLSRPDLPLGDTARHALDRARPFLSMLITPAGRYCMDTKTPPTPAVVETAPLGFAPQSLVARLTAGKTVVIVMPDTNCLNLFSGSQTLFNAGLFQHAPDDDLSTLAMTSDSSNDGQWLQHETALQQRTVFLASSGDDVRVEDRLTVMAKPAWMRLTLPEAAKISVARNGTQATIALEGRNLWQLSLRGGILMSQGADDQWLIKTSGTCINWALKRMARSAPRPGKAELPELPF
jgi:hypothetical protein